jgi:hypothetical protein
VPALLPFGLGQPASAPLGPRYSPSPTAAGLGPPFSSIPKRQPRYKRYARLVARILLEERALVELLGRVNSDLDRRIRVRRLTLQRRALAMARALWPAMRC